MPVTIAASFAVGFSDQSWQHAGPYYGDGETFPKACLDALSKCSMDFEERETEFVTFLGKPKEVQRPEGAVEQPRPVRRIAPNTNRCCHARR